ncbi:MAG: hypothetical protein ACRDNL_22385 [Spirillospora sp.]
MHTDRMGADTGRNADGSRLDHYWRRRAVALICVLGAVALLAWACTGDSGGTGGSGKAGDDEPVRNAGVVGSASPGAPPTSMPTVTVTTTKTPEPAPADDGGPCREDDLVVSMSSSRDAYAGGAKPEFRVTVVNMGNGACVFDKGGLDVRVTSGADRIWSSAECRRADRKDRANRGDRSDRGDRGGPSNATLRRGIPYVDTVTWNRTRGCKPGPPARPGTYVADLKGHKAKKQIFRLH